MKKIELEIIALSHSVTQSHSFAVVLGEVDGTRRLPIVIGGFEAQAIAVALDNMKPSRPLTHDLMKTVCDTFGLELQYIYISKLLDGVFYSNLVFSNSIETVEIDSRTSDALALAVRFECPIYVNEDILEEAGVEADAAMEGSSTVTEGDLEKRIEELTSVSAAQPGASTNYSNMTAEELNEALQHAIENEDYERAARIRDELNKRQ
ncbi:MAG: bifunctional nuclease family protein [Bacteroidetes bacterium]|nr:bifunctional nuclease family protein [Bacteroidota bacterium]MBS1683581.1 bifunctional nuclease family protein [Bacteroidota bacterium]